MLTKYLNQLRNGRKEKYPLDYRCNKVTNNWKTALKGRINSAQCEAKRSVGKTGDPLGGGLKA